MTTENDPLPSDPLVAWDVAVNQELARLRRGGDSVEAVALARGGDLDLPGEAHLRARAVSAVMNREPALHAAWLEAYNARHAPRPQRRGGGDRVPR